MEIERHRDKLPEHSRILSLKVPESGVSCSVHSLNHTDFNYTVTQEGSTESHTVLSIHSSFVVLPATSSILYTSGPREYFSAKCENELLVSFVCSP